MPRLRQEKEPLSHPDTGDINLLEVLHALADPTRMIIVETLRHDNERACGNLPVDVAPSTLTHHLSVLRDAGVIRQREEGNRRWNALRLEDLDARFPGFLDAILTAYNPKAHKPAPKPTAQTPRARAAATFGEDPPFAWLQNS